MLHTAAVKISLREPRNKLSKMFRFMQHYGTRELHLVHVRTKSHFHNRQEVEERLEAIAEEVRGMGFHADVHIHNGHAPTVILQVAEEVGAGYVAVYWRAKPMLRNALLGSIDADILRMSQLPVFIYNPKLFRPDEDLSSVLYATDFQYTDAVVMPYLKHSRFKARSLYLLHVGERAPDPDTEAKRVAHARENLQRLADECAHAYDTVEIVEVVGSVRGQIVKQANRLAVELIVVGKSENPDAMSRIVGSTAEILPHKARCSVFIIPGICSLDDAAAPHPEKHGNEPKEGAA